MDCYLLGVINILRLLWACRKYIMPTGLPFIALQINAWLSQMVFSSDERKMRRHYITTIKLSLRFLPSKTKIAYNEASFYFVKFR